MLSLRSMLKKHILYFHFNTPIIILFFLGINYRANKKSVINQSVSLYNCTSLEIIINTLLIMEGTGFIYLTVFLVELLMGQLLLKI